MILVVAGAAVVFWGMGAAEARERMAEITPAVVSEYCIFGYWGLKLMVEFC